MQPCSSPPSRPRARRGRRDPTPRPRVTARPRGHRMAVTRIATIGVYDWDVEHFLAALHEHSVTQLLDVRQRRGVRGREYAWANAARLQAALADAGVEYRHLKELAPTTDLRRLQYREDERLGVGKRSRVELAPEYRARYMREILDTVDLGPVVEAM